MQCYFSGNGRHGLCNGVQFRTTSKGRMISQLKPFAIQFKINNHVVPFFIFQNLMVDL